VKIESPLPRVVHDRPGRCHSPRASSALCSVTTGQFRPYLRTAHETHRLGHSVGVDCESLGGSDQLPAEVRVDGVARLVNDHEISARPDSLELPYACKGSLKIKAAVYQDLRDVGKRVGAAGTSSCQAPSDPALKRAGARGGPGQKVR